MEPEIRILADGAAIAKRAAQEFVQAATAAVRERGAFHVALAGGSTPKALYGLLATDPVRRSQVPWDKMQVFFGDERHVAPDHPDSNFRMATEAMLSKVPLNANQVTRIKGEYGDAGQGLANTRKRSPRISIWEPASFRASTCCLWEWATRGTRFHSSRERRRCMRTGASPSATGSASSTQTALP